MQSEEESMESEESQSSQYSDLAVQQYVEVQLEQSSQQEWPQEKEEKEKKLDIVILEQEDHHPNLTKWRIRALNILLLVIKHHSCLLIDNNTQEKWERLMMKLAGLMLCQHIQSTLQRDIGLYLCSLWPHIKLKTNSHEIETVEAILEVVEGEEERNGSGVIGMEEWEMEQISASMLRFSTTNSSILSLEQTLTVRYLYISQVSTDRIHPHYLYNLDPTLQYFYQPFPHYNFQLSHSRGLLYHNTPLHRTSFTFNPSIVAVGRCCAVLGRIFSLKDMQVLVQWLKREYYYEDLEYWRVGEVKGVKSTGMGGDGEGEGEGEGEVEYYLRTTSQMSAVLMCWVLWEYGYYPIFKDMTKSNLPLSLHSPRPQPTLLYSSQGGYVGAGLEEQGRSIKTVNEHLAELKIKEDSIGEHSMEM